MIVRSLPNRRDCVFLTFDDGPDAVGTAAILDVLMSKKARATFFLVAEKLHAARPLVERIRREGHALGNHSLDHDYSHYFCGSVHLQAWIQRAEEEFAACGIPATELVGFRPPAGILTPPLCAAAKATNTPIILWNERFFDTVFSWSAARAATSARQMTGGSIVLLHDRQPPERIVAFCATLGAYIDDLLFRGFNLMPLPYGGTNGS